MKKQEAASAGASARSWTLADSVDSADYNFCLVRGFSVSKEAIYIPHTHTVSYSCELSPQRSLKIRGPAGALGAGLPRLRRLHRDKRAADLRCAPAFPPAARPRSFDWKTSPAHARPQAAGCSLLGPGDNAWYARVIGTFTCVRKSRPLDYACEPDRRRCSTDHPPCPFACSPNRFPLALFELVVGRSNRRTFTSAFTLVRLRRRRSFYTRLKTLKHVRVQSCAIAIRSPASERSSDLIRYPYPLLASVRFYPYPTRCCPLEMPPLRRELPRARTAGRDGGAHQHVRPER